MSLRQLKFKPSLQPNNLKAKRDINRGRETCENTQDDIRNNHQSPSSQIRGSEKYVSHSQINLNENKNSDLLHSQQEVVNKQWVDNEVLSSETNHTLAKSHNTEGSLSKLNDGSRSESPCNSDIQLKQQGEPEVNKEKSTFKEEESCDVISLNQIDLQKHAPHEVPRGKVSFSLRQRSFKPKLQSFKVVRSSLGQEKPKEKEATPSSNEPVKKQSPTAKQVSGVKKLVSVSKVNPKLPDSNKDLIEVIEIEDDIRDHINKYKNCITLVRGRQHDRLLLGTQNLDKTNAINVSDDIKDKLFKITQKNPTKRVTTGDLSTSNSHVADSADDLEPFEHNIGDILQQMKDNFTAKKTSASSNVGSIKKDIEDILQKMKENFMGFPIEPLQVSEVEKNIKTVEIEAQYNEKHIDDTNEIKERESKLIELDNPTKDIVTNNSSCFNRKRPIKIGAKSIDKTKTLISEDSKISVEVPDSAEIDPEGPSVKSTETLVKKPCAVKKKRKCKLDRSGDSMEVLDTTARKVVEGTPIKMIIKSIRTDSSSEKKWKSKLCDSEIETLETFESLQDKCSKKEKDVPRKLFRHLKHKPALSSCGSKKPLLKSPEQGSSDAVKEGLDFLSEKCFDSPKCSTKSFDKSDSMDLNYSEEITEDICNELDDLDKQLNFKSFMSENTNKENPLDSTNLCTNKQSNVIPHNMRGPIKPTLLSKIKRPVKRKKNAQIEFTRKFGDVLKPPDSSQLTILDSIFYNPPSNPMPKTVESETAVILEESSSRNGKKNGNTSKNDDRDSEEISETNDNSEVPVPQLKLSANRKIIISEDSLVIDQPLGKFEEVAGNQPRNSKEKKERRIQQRRQGWSHEETLKFYKALHSVGTDFETMKELFPGRSRANLKSKYKKEEKLHRDLIDKVTYEFDEYNVEDALEELEFEREMAKADKSFEKTMMRSRRKNKDEEVLVEKKGRSKFTGLSAKELSTVLKGDDINVIDKKDDEPDKSEKRRGRPARKRKKLIEVLLSELQKRMESDNEDELSSESSSPPSSEEQQSDHIVISTNVDYEHVKYTRYITYNADNLDIPIDINETISHE